jgi:hypothetical protein
MEFKCEINMDNDAFAHDPEQELLRAIKNISKDIQDFWHTKRMKAIWDSNGNKIGKWTIGESK